MSRSLTTNQIRRIQAAQYSKVRRRSPPQISNRQPARPRNVPWIQNWPLIIGAVSVSFIAGRLLGVAAGDPETAYAVLQEQGTASVVVGSLIPAVGLLAFPAAVLAMRAQANNRYDKTTHGLLFAVLVGALILTFFTAPALVLGGSVALAFFTAIAHQSTLAFGRKKHRRSPFNLHPSLNEVATIYTIVVLTLITLNSVPWLPSVEISMKSRAHFTGYVLSQNNGTTSILRKTPVSVLQIASGSISSITDCKPSDYFENEETINQLFGDFMNKGPFSIGNVKYPRCSN
jgi:hypothetical protein